ncbi:MAG: tetratricopeptide repeat-containing sensor histidine kinase [Bacteroidota bacterium]
MKRVSLYVLVFVGVIVRPISGYSQTIPEIKERLRDARTAADFDKEFGNMISTFHEGKLHFVDSDVADIVGLAQAKPFADTILPAVYGWAGNMYGDGRMHEAIVYFLHSAELFAKLGKHKSEALCYFQIALVQHKAENYGEAQDFYRKALTTSDSLDNRTMINCYNGLALIKREAKEYDVAEKDFRNAYKIAVVHHDSAWIAILLGNLGSLHLRRENYDSALVYYQKNLGLVKKTTEFENEIETYVNLAKVYLGKDNVKNTFAYLDSAVAFIANRKINFNDFFNPMDEVNRLYALAWAHRGDYKKAFDYYSRFHAVSEEKQDRVNGRSLKQLQLSYSFEQKQNELELLQKVNQANLATIQQQRYLEYASVFIIGLLSILALVTYQTSRQRKKLNRDLANTNSELERLNKMKNKLFSVISHDLRTPLGNLQSILGLYQTGDLNAADVATVAAKLGQQVSASGYVLENLLEWAKSELNERKINPATVLLREKVVKVFDQFHSDLKAKNITARNEVPADIEVWADRAQMQIVLRNLLTNAIKFTKENGVVTISAVKHSSYVNVMVNDTGVGMTDEQLSKLFQSDQVVTTQGTNKEKGSGIGLLITKELLVNNGGSIKVESTKDVGTTFTLTLPVKNF